MKRNCVIIDDEPLAANVIKNHVSRIPSLELKGVFYDAMESYELLQQGEVDIVFLDIKMANLSGLEFAASLHPSPLIIFTTAYSEFALDAFEADAVDYLVKPIEFTRFLRAVNKALLRLSPSSPPSISQESPEDNDFMFVKVDQKKVKVYFKDILYVEGMQKYVKVVCRDQRHVVHIGLSRLHESLPEHTFFRIHKSYIINLKEIQSIEGNTVHIGGIDIPISKGKKSSFKAMISDKSVE